MDIIGSQYLAEKEKQEENSFLHSAVFRDLHEQLLLQMDARNNFSKDLK